MDLSESIFVLNTAFWVVLQFGDICIEIPSWHYKVQFRMFFECTHFIMKLACFPSQNLGHVFYWDGLDWIICSLGRSPSEYWTMSMRYQKDLVSMMTSEKSLQLNRYESLYIVLTFVILHSSDYSHISWRLFLILQNVNK